MAELCLNLFNESVWHGKLPDFSAWIRAAAAAGFESVGPDIFSLDRYAKEGGSLARIAGEISDSGLRCAEIAALLVNADPAELDAQLETFVPVVRALRPEWILVNSDVDPCADSAALFRRAADRLREHGAKLALEFLAMTRVNTIAGALEVIERSGVPDAGVLVDTWHFFLGPNSWADLDRLPRERIAYLQFDDHPALASDDLHDETLNRRAFPGEGRFELERFAREFRSRGFDGLVSVEVLNQERRGREPAAFARRAFETSARYWR
jgi:sugar phosphate isomerase/epimerase